MVALLHFGVQPGGPVEEGLVQLDAHLQRERPDVHFEARCRLHLQAGHWGRA